MTSVSKKRLNLNSYNVIDIEDWTYNNNGEPVKISSEKTIECDFNETDVTKIRGQDLTSRAFLRLTEEKLTCKPGLYELKPSPAESIMELVEELNEN
ncbi:14969_t:CDS:2 [Racocetra fulgida]|uniref:14969_t:CDS:1 n=1 Tax=Racocetra fulgida TaxID=60492 RepID=A0A9N9AJJ8_9GLOM|nr:14969_t:CDS:2 [Racocetra fulgida]